MNNLSPYKFVDLCQESSEILKTNDEQFLGINHLGKGVEDSDRHKSTQS